MGWTGKQIVTGWGISLWALGGVACAARAAPPVEPAGSPAVHQEEAHAPHQGPGLVQAVAVVGPTEGQGVQGRVTFEATAEGMAVMAVVSGLTPGNHGFHIHDYGDCSAPDGTSAGGHFNPLGHVHGGPEATERHIGDLGNLTADDEGHARREWVDAHLVFRGPTSIVGRSIIIHAGEDDLSTQPTGGAGARVACGVIGVAPSP